MNSFPAISSNPGTRGLPYRDLLSGCYAGTLSLPALCQKLQSVFGADLVPSFEYWRPILRKWLSTVPEHPVLLERLESAEIERLVEDPPLVFFVMLEATEGGQGKHLGPVASIIVAETIFGAMSANPIVGAEAGSTLQGRINACAGSLFPNNKKEAATALADIGEIASMPELLRYLERSRVLASAA